MSTAIIKPQWSFVTIALMVLGFILFWPLGLAMLAYILWGERFGGSAEKAEAWMNDQKRQWRSERRHCGGRHHNRRHNHRHYSTGNAAFDDYREEQLKRLDEERKRLDDEIREFGDYLDNLHKARDREEFDRFMRDRRNSASRSEQRDDTSPWNENQQHNDGSNDDGNRQGY